MKPALSRRALLRGVGGAAISLPFFEAMLGPHRSVAQPAAVPKRVVFFFTSCGIVPDTWWPTSGGETGFVLPSSLQPLEPHRAKLLIPDGISMETARADSVSANGHDKGTAHCLTARTTVEGPSGRGEFGHLWDGTAGGISIDQHVANHLEGATPYRSLEFGVKAEGIAQALPSRISYRASGEPVIPMNDAGAAFDRIFAPLASGASEAAARKRRRALVLDAVRGDLTRVRSMFGTDDRRRLDAHIASITEVQRQLDELSAATCTGPTRESSSEYPALGRIQMDLMVHALACDLTRVASIQWANGQSGIRHAWLGHGAGHHGISHETGSQPSDWDANKTWKTVASEIDRWYAEQFAYLLASLDAIEAGDGQSLLDHTVVLWVNEQEQGIDNRHSWGRMPYIIGGSGGGAFRTGRHVQVDAPHANLFVEIMQAIGMPDTTFGEPDLCTGGIAGLA